MQEITFTLKIDRQELIANKDLVGDLMAQTNFISRSRVVSSPASDTEQTLERLWQILIAIEEELTKENPDDSVFHCRPLHSLIGDSDKYTLEVLKKNPDCPAEIVEWAKTAKIGDVTVIGEVKCTRLH